MRLEDSTYRAFLALLQNSLWKTPIPEGMLPLTVGQWDAIYRMSWGQAVTGIIYDAIQTLPRSSGLKLSQIGRWMSSAAVVEENNAHMDAAIEQMQALWREHGITALIQKGQNIARMYPVPSHRVSGDIDWHFPTRKDWKAALELVKAYNPETDSDGDLHYVRDGIVMEHHRKGIDHSDTISVLVMINEHILHHALVMGVGFKHFCDMAVAYHYYAGQYSPDELRQELRRQHLTGWTNLLDATLVQEFGMPQEYLPFPVEGEPEVGKLMELVIADGNLGLDKENRYAGFGQRASLFLGCCPGKFLSRWTNLVIGRLFRGVRSQE